MSKKINHEAVSSAEELVKLLKAFDTEIDAVRTLVNELRTDHGTMISALAAMSGDYLVNSAGLAIGSTVQNVANLQFSFIINGKLYTKAAVAAGTAPGNDVVPQNKYGCVAFDIGTNLTIDAVEATGNATGFDSALLAAAALPAVEADHVRIGYVTAMKSDGAFTFGATALNAANTTVAYANTAGLFYTIGGSIPAALTAAAVTEQIISPK